MRARPDELASLAALSARVGSDPRLVQGAGGNASLEDAGVLWVKASGTWLADALRREIFLPLDVADLRARLASDAAEPLAGLVGPGGLRPSIETSLHALLPQRVVLHVHSIDAIALAVLEGGAAVAAERLEGLRWAWVPYRRPGIPLTRAIEAALARGAGAAPPEVLLLANHGLVVAAESVDAVDSLLSEVQHRLAVPPRAAAAVDEAALAGWLGGDEAWRAPEDPAVHALALDAAALAVARRGALYPDHVVFLGAGWPEARVGEAPGAAAERHAARFGKAPSFVVAPDVGVAVSRAITAGAERMLECLAALARCRDGDGALTVLSDEDVAALLDWDAEAYRQALDASAASPRLGRLRRG